MKTPFESLGSKEVVLVIPEHVFWLDLCWLDPSRRMCWSEGPVLEPEEDGVLLGSDAGMRLCVFLDNV